MKVEDFVRAYRKSDPTEYNEEIVDKNNTKIVLPVKCPGIMFICLHSEILREQAFTKARGLGGRRHRELNHKYFVSKVKCEATQASEEKHSKTV